MGTGELNYRWRTHEKITDVVLTRACSLRLPVCGRHSCGTHSVRLYQATSTVYCVASRLRLAVSR